MTLPSKLRSLGWMAVVFAGLLAPFCGSSHADVISWKTGTSGTWTTNGNWNGGVVPTSSDSVVFANGMADLVGNIALQGLSVTGTSSSPAMINGAYQIDLRDLSWSGVGYFFGFLGTSIADINVSGTASLTGTNLILSTRNLNILGEASFQGQLSLSSGATLNIAQGATFTSRASTNGLSFQEITASQDFVFDGITYKNGVYNKGTLIQDSGGVSTNIWASFNNTGSVQVKTGKLGIGGGVSSGSFDVSAGATLQFISGTQAIVGGTITNEGTLKISSGLNLGSQAAYSGSGSVIMDLGTFVYEGDRSFSSLEFLNGLIRGSGSLNLGSLNWHGGSGIMDGGGTTNVSGAASFGYYRAIVGSTGNGARILNLNGPTSFSGSGIDIGPGSIVRIGNSGRFENLGQSVQGSLYDTTFDSVGGGAAEFDVLGTYIQNSSFRAGIFNATFNNSGTVLVQSGQLILRGGGQSTGDVQVLKNGTLEVPAGSYGFSGLSLANAGTFAVSGGSVDVSSAFSNTGTIQLSSGQLRLRNLTNFDAGTGTLQSGTYRIINSNLQIDLGGSSTVPGRIVSNAAAVYMNGTGSAITNASRGNGALTALEANQATGIIELISGASITTSANFSNFGRLIVGGGSSFIADSASFSNLSSGQINASGTIRATDVFVRGGFLSGNGRIEGNLHVSGGTVAPGTPVSLSSLSGTLSVVGDLELGSNSVLEYGLYAKRFSFGSASPSITPGAALLDVTGSALLNGTLLVHANWTNFNGFLALNSPIIILSGHNVTNHFASIVVSDLPGQYALAVQYGINTVSISVTPVPEPSEWLLLLSGLALVGIKVRSQKRSAQAGK